MQQLVSVIVPVYNMEDSLEECVLSICNQDYENIEIILVDDGSNDNSLEICNKLSEKDSRIRYIHTENQGSGPARNIGIENSKGDYLYFPDADDFIDPHAITTLTEATENGKYDLIVFGYRNMRRSGEVILEKKYNLFTNAGENIRKDYSDYFGMSGKYGVQGAPWNKFFSGKIVRNNNIEYPSLRRHQDEGFISRYMCHTEYVKFIPDILYTYYPNTASLEWKKYPANYEDCAIGVYKIWKNTICTWNESDRKTHLMVDAEYLSKIMKSLELSYSPKVKKNPFTRPALVKEICKKVEIEKIGFDCAGSAYQRLALRLARMHLYMMLTLVLYLGTVKTKVRQGK